MNILVIDKNPIIKSWIENVISHMNGFKLIGQYKKASDLFPSLLINKPNLLILSDNIDDASIIQLVLKIKKRTPNIPLLVLSGETSPEFLFRLYRLNVEGIMDKSGNFNLSDALKSILMQKRYIQPDIADSLIEFHQSKYISSYNDLTDREYEIFKKSITGFKCETIANLLNISRRTVCYDRKEILRKLDAYSFDEIKNKAGQ